MDAWVEETDGVSWVGPVGAILGFLLLPEGVTGTVLVDRGVEEGTRIVPGVFLGDDRHARVGSGQPPERPTGGLERPARAPSALLPPMTMWNSLSDLFS